MELKIDYGPGYRLYFAQIGVTIIVLLFGGDKSTQNQDMETYDQLLVNCQNPDLSAISLLLNRLG
jgi:putative addiction module killer protein